MSNPDEHFIQCFFFSPRKKFSTRENFHYSAREVFKVAEKKILKAAREKKMCPRKKNENFAREKKNPSREKNAKFCPRKLKKYPRKNLLQKSDMNFFSCYFCDFGGLMLWRVFLFFLMLSSKLYYRYFGLILCAPAASLSYYDLSKLCSCLHWTSTLIIFGQFFSCLRRSRRTCMWF